MQKIHVNIHLLTGNKLSQLFRTFLVFHYNVIVYLFYFPVYKDYKIKHLTQEFHDKFTQRAAFHVEILQY